MGITGRPKVQNPKSVMASVRITEMERDRLVEVFGTVNGGLRHALDELMLTAAGRVRIEPATRAGTGNATGSGLNFEPIVDEVKELDDPFVTGETFATAVKERRIVLSKPHVHKPASLVSSRHSQGELLETWECECGTYLPERKAK